MPIVIRSDMVICPGCGSKYHCAMDVCPICGEPNPIPDIIFVDEDEGEAYVYCEGIFESSEGVVSFA